MTVRPIRRRLLSSAAILGAIAGLASPAQALPIPPLDPTRVIQATDTADAGHSYTPGGAVDIIDINAPTVIINWTPIDPNANPIGFVKQNGEARFQSPTDFAVLNRVTPTNGHPIQFDGDVTSFVNGTPGGTVMFYSADGFIIGPTGTFNVGSLVLTTGDITGAFSTNSFKTGTPNVTSAITNDGTLGASNYIVLAAPKITQNGNVITPSAAFVAAGATSFSFNLGLFDIIVDNAIDNAQITHSAAGITLFATAPAGYTNRLYMVAVPKNDAMALLLTGNIGYPQIVDAQLESGQVVLSAGRSVKDIDGRGEFDSVADAGKGGIQFTNGSYNVQINARATGDVTLQATGNGLVSLGSGAFIASDSGSAQLLADDGDIDAPGSITVTSLAGQTGIAKVSVSNGHTIELQGNLIVSAADNRATGAAHGGTANITVNNGALIVGGTQFAVDASATTNGNDASDATGGSASISLTDAQLSGPDLAIAADAQAANAPAGGGVAGIGQGGTVSFETHPTTDLTLTSITLSASGRGGSGSPDDNSAVPAEGDASGKGGAGFGGTATISFDSGAASNTVLGGLDITAFASGGNGSGNCLHCKQFNGEAGGDATGGTVSLTLASGSLGAQHLNLTSNATGGDGNSGFGQIILGVPTAIDGGNAGGSIAGSSSVTVSGGTLTVNTISLKSQGLSGRGGQSIEYDDATDPMHIIHVPGGVGGDAAPATAGTAAISVTGGKLVSSGVIELDARGDAQQAGFGSQLSGGAAIGQGGIASVSASGSGSIDVLGLFVRADGTGSGSAPGGTGLGGAATVTADGTTITSTITALSAAGNGGPSLGAEPNGDGHGGNATINVINGGTMTIDSLSSDASGNGSGIAGTSDGSGTLHGGSGSGGEVHLNLDGAGSQLNVTGTIALTSFGSGGYGESVAGDADNSGAFAQLAVTNGAVLNYTSPEPIEISAAAVGGATDDFNDPVQIDGAPGGSAKGGTAELFVGGGALTLPVKVIIDASATGGSALGPGGNAVGGTASVRVGPGGTLTANEGLSLDASARAGQGVDGGFAQGGTAILNAVAGTTHVTNGLTLLSTGLGGDSIPGGHGGAGTGGFTQIALGDGNPQVTLDTLDTDSSGTGGSADYAGGVAGEGQGGTSSIDGPAGTLTVTGTARMQANATGGIATTGTPGDAEGGVVTLSDNSDVVVHLDGTTTLNANAAGGTSGSIRLFNDRPVPGQELRFANLIVNAAGAASTVPGEYSFLVKTASDHRIVVTNNATIDVGGNALFDSTDSGGFDVGGTLDFTSGGKLSFLHSGTDALNVLTANSAKFTVGDFFAEDDALVSTTSLLEVDSGLDIKAKRLKSASVVLKAARDIVITQMIDPVSAEGETVTLGNDGDLNVTHASATKSVMLTSLTGGVTAADVTAGAGNVAAGDVTAQGATFVTFNGTVGTPNGSVIGLAPTINVNGQLQAPTITLTSATLTIGGAAQLGKAGLTNLLTITNNGTDPSTIGGAGGGPGYVISAAALNQMRARQIVLSLPTLGLPGTPDVTVQSFTLDAPTIFGSGDGGLSIDPPGSIAVTGAVKITNANPGTVLSFDATDSITVVTPGGSIALLGAANQPGGVLNLSANQIVVASQSAINDLATTTTIEERDNRLAQVDDPNDAGPLQAGGMNFLAKNAIYIQNSGTGKALTKRRGFTVGNGGLTITTQDFPMEIILNGRQTRTATTFYLGDTLIPKVTFITPVAGVLNFDPKSTINGCVILNAPCTVTSGIPLPPIQDVVNFVANNDPPTGDQTGQGPIQAVNMPLIQFAGSTPYSFSPPIDEPVTGAGNQDLWTGGQQAPWSANQGCGGAGKPSCP